MKKFLLVLISTLFLFSTLAIAKNKEYNGDKYRPRQHKERRVHKEDRHLRQHKPWKRGHSYYHKKYYNKNPHWYRGHHTWSRWYSSERYRHPHGTYHRENNQMMFSYCEGGMCFSFSIGD